MVLVCLGVGLVDPEMGMRGVEECEIMVLSIREGQLRHLRVFRLFEFIIKCARGVIIIVHRVE
jgi:hypothetical protein